MPSTEITVSSSFSGSLSFVIMLELTDPVGRTVLESSSAYGAPLSPWSVSVTVAASVPPLPSEITYSNVTKAVSLLSRESK